MSDELFARIIAGEIPARIIHDDEHVLAFLDINPRAPGHFLVIPKRKAANILDCPVADFQHVMLITQALARRVVKALTAHGCSIVHSAGAAAQQDVPWLHVHVIPRFKDDALDIWKGTSVQEVDLDAIHEKILAQDQ